MPTQSAPNATTPRSAPAIDGSTPAPGTSSTVSKECFILRPAMLGDLQELVRLENRCFSEDRLSRRSFKHFLQGKTAAITVAEIQEGLAGYVLVLLHRGTSLARLYSIAVDPACRGRGLGIELMLAAEAIALRHRRAYLRLEVRKDNSTAIALYQQLGYLQFGSFPHYYEDDQDALRFEKRILHGPAGPIQPHLAYYPQSTEFTCGPAALMMALHALNPDLPLDRSTEMQLWRESTTIFMLAGHGGCSPLGLALAAHTRGFGVRIIANQDTPFFVESVRGANKKAVVELVHRDFLQTLAARGVIPEYREPVLADLEQALGRGEQPLVLISTWRFDRKKSPHWVLVSGMDSDFVYLHDPFLYEKDMRLAVDNQYLPVAREKFLKMCCFGQSRLRTMVILSGPLSL